MKDFEARLRSLSFREPPAGLRREILAAVAAAVEPRWSWGDWLWPSPMAWAGLAALLLAAWMINPAPVAPAPRPAIAQTAHSASPTLYAFQARQDYFSILETSR